MNIIPTHILPFQMIDLSQKFLGLSLIINNNGNKENTKMVKKYSVGLGLFSILIGILIIVFTVGYFCPEALPCMLAIVITLTGFFFIICGLFSIIGHYEGWEK